jgi:hypothetical protein
MTTKADFTQHRLLLYYKGDISALTLFAQHECGSVCLPEPLPELSSILQPDSGYRSKISVHPAVLVQHLNRQLNLDNDLLNSESGYCEYVETPQGVIAVYMARFNILDPPHRLMQSLGYRLRTLTELRNRPSIELELLRRAYVKVMES